jgi:hypothetical protein
MYQWPYVFLKGKSIVLFSWLIDLGPLSYLCILNFLAYLDHAICQNQAA